MKLPMIVSALLLSLAGSVISIRGGSDAYDGIAPYHAAIYRSGVFWCNGAFIGTRTVVTTARCVIGSVDSPENIKIHYNSLERKKGSSISVSKVLIHPHYNPNNLDHDVAVVTLPYPFMRAENAEFISVGWDTVSTQYIKYTAWGPTSLGGPLANRMQSAYSINTNDCKHYRNITSTMFCRVLSNNTRMCDGDEGAPAVLDEYYPNRLTGLLSWGYDCGTSNSPSVFTNLTAPSILKWINQVRCQFCDYY